MEIRADVGEHGLDTVMLIAELDDVNVAMNATPSQVDIPIALFKRMKHALKVPQVYSGAARSGADFRDAYSAAELQ
eukprot:6021960-Pleurochrysis_carterae.AAC.1